MSKISLVALFVAAAVMLSVSGAHGDPSDIPERGTVSSSDGKPMEGVVVSARAENKTITTSVYTDSNGSYSFPSLEDGLYQIWAQAVGFAADRADVRFSAGKTVEKNFTLKPIDDFGKQLSGSEWLASLPEGTPEDRRFKRLIGINCDTCHSVGLILQNSFDVRSWTAILNFMEKTNSAGIFSFDVSVEAEHPNPNINPYIHGYKEELAAYLARVRGPVSGRLLYKPLPRPTGEATQIVVTEYDVSPGHLPDYRVVNNGSDWSYG